MSMVMELLRDVAGRDDVHVRHNLAVLTKNRHKREK